MPKMALENLTSSKPFVSPPNSKHYIKKENRLPETLLQQPQTPLLTDPLIHHEYNQQHEPQVKNHIICA
jgi:hypothetical protein